MKYNGRILFLVKGELIDLPLQLRKHANARHYPPAQEIEDESCVVAGRVHAIVRRRSAYALLKKSRTERKLGTRGEVNRTRTKIAIPYRSSQTR